MKKLMRIFFTMILSLMILNGCTINNNPQEDNGDDNGDNVGNMVEYEVVDNINSLSEDMKQYIENVKYNRGFTNLREGDYNWIVITSGEKPTGGYDIEVQSVEEINKILDIKVNEISPKEGSVVTEALTYPIIVLSIPDGYTNFKVSNSKEEEFEYIPPNRINIKEEGRYIGQIDNNFIEIEVDNEPKTFNISEEVRPEIEKLKDNTMINFEYYINENDQYVISNIYNSNNDGETINTAEGIYQGRIDNFSIEIMIDGEPRAFINYDMEKLLEGIEDGDKVKIEYTENEHGQLELKNLEKID